MSSRIVGLLVFSVFHLSSSYSLFVFFKLACKALADSDPSFSLLVFIKLACKKRLADSGPDVPAMDVFSISLLAALVMFVTELLPPKGTITRFLSRLHTRCKSVLPSFFCFLIITAYSIVIEDAPDALDPSYGVFVISMASFLALHAPKEVSCLVSESLLVMHVFFSTRDFWTGFFLLWKGGDLTTVLASGIANVIGVWLTHIVHVYRLGGLRYPDKEPDVISDMVSDKVSV